MPFLSDTCTDAAGTALASHTGETGATWTQRSMLGDSIPVVVTDANRLRATSGGGNFGGYYASGLPASPNYDVLATVYCQTVTGTSIGLLGRLSTDGANGYIVLYDVANTRWDLFKLVAGSVTSLGTFSQTLSPATGYTVTLELRTATKKVFIDGVERISSSDNSVTAAGRAGGWFGGAVTNSTGLHLDTITATDVVVSLPISEPFTGSAGTAIAALANGVTWTQAYSVSVDGVVTDANRLRNNGASEGAYYADGTPSSADYDVSCDVVKKSTVTGLGVGPCGRMAIDGSDFYLALYSEALAGWGLFKRVGGSFAQLGSTYSHSPTIDQAYTVKLEMRGTAIKLFLDGVQRVSVTDSDLTAVGKAGVWLNIQSTNSTGVHLDNFAAANPAGGGGGAKGAKTRRLGRTPYGVKGVRVY